MESLFALMTILIPIVTALTSMLKKYIPSKYHAIIPLAVGLIVAPLAIPLVDTSISELMWAGALSGLSSGGFYSVQNIRNK